MLFWFGQMIFHNYFFPLRCNDTSLKLWKDQELMNSQVFEVTCGLGGTFLPPEIHPEKIKRNYLNGWPLCDRATPAKCSNYQPANAEQLQIVELIKKEDQLPGMSLFYTSFYRNVLIS